MATPVFALHTVEPGLPVLWFKGWGGTYHDEPQWTDKWQDAFLAPQDEILIERAMVRCETSDYIAGRLVATL